MFYEAVIESLQALHSRKMLIFQSAFGQTTVMVKDIWTLHRNAANEDETVT